LMRVPHAGHTTNPDNALTFQQPYPDRAPSGRPLLLSERAL
jgi:hypothetical protein